MSLLFKNDIDRPSEPPLHPLAPPLDAGGPDNNGMAIPLNPTSVYSVNSLGNTSSSIIINNASMPKTLFTQPSNSQQNDGSRSAFRSLGSEKSSGGVLKPVTSEMSPQIARRAVDTNSQEETTRSAFRPVGGASITSPAVKPGIVPLIPDRSPHVSRRLDTSSDQDTVSPTPSSTASESQPATPAAVQEPFTWPTHNSEENRQLLGTEEESSDRQSSDDEEEEKNVWLITAEQMSYYTTQFRSMQPNLIGVIPGTQAKEFFEKSRLPIQELRKIWQLSDVTKDGCLSLEEFLTAMHLVVLRRNDISLPEELPPCLNPINLKHKVVDRHNKDLYDVSNQRTHNILDTSAGNDSLELSPTASRNGGGSTVGGGSGGGSGNRAVLDSTVDSVASPESLVSSPGGRPKPVKFDFNAVDPSKDPSIAVPIPHRASPESPILCTSDEDSPQTIGIQPFQKQPGKHRVLYEQLRNQEDSGGGSRAPGARGAAPGARGSGGGPSTGVGGARNRSWSTDSSSSSDQETDKDVVDHLQPMSSSPLSRITGPVSLPYIQSSVEPLPLASAVRGPLALQKKEGVPPSPPPRPGKTHARSSSLDLAQLAKKMPGLPGLPALLSRDISNRRIADSTEELEPTVRDHKEISANIHKYKESVALLKRTVTELSQEVSDTMEERVVLEYQLEQLKSFGNQD